MNWHRTKVLVSGGASLTDWYYQTENRAQVAAGLGLRLTER